MDSTHIVLVVDENIVDLDKEEGVDVVAEENEKSDAAKECANLVESFAKRITPRKKMKMGLI